MRHGWQIENVYGISEAARMAEDGWEPYAVANGVNESGEKCRVHYLKRKLPSDAKAEYELACLQEQHFILKTCVELLKLNPSPENPAWELALRIATRKDDK